MVSLVGWGEILSLSVGLVSPMGRIRYRGGFWWGRALSVILLPVSGAMERWVERSRLRSERFSIQFFRMRLPVNLAVLNLFLR